MKKNKTELPEFLSDHPIIAVVVIDDPTAAVPLAETLLKAGIGAIELTLRTPTAFDSLQAIQKHCPEMQAGVGTALTPAQVNRAAELNAAFAVAPGMNSSVIKAAAEHRLPFAPGIATPIDVEKAVECGCRTLKFFPAEALGGVTYLKSMASPYAYLELRYIPLGGLNLENFTTYLSLYNVLAVGGSRVAPRESILEKNWSSIAENARQAVDCLK